MTDLSKITAENAVKVLTSTLNSTQYKNLKPDAQITIINFLNNKAQGNECMPIDTELSVVICLDDIADMAELPADTDHSTDEVSQGWEGNPDIKEINYDDIRPVVAEQTIYPKKPSNSPAVNEETPQVDISDTPISTILDDIQNDDKDKYDKMNNALKTAAEYLAHNKDGSVDLDGAGDLTLNEIKNIYNDVAETLDEEGYANDEDRQSAENQCNAFLYLQQLLEDYSNELNNLPQAEEVTEVAEAAEVEPQEPASSPAVNEEASGVDISDIPISTILDDIQTDKTKHENMNNALNLVAEHLAHNEDGSVDLDAARNLTLTDLKNQISIDEEILENEDYNTDSDRVLYENRVNAYTYLQQLLEDYSEELNAAPPAEEVTEVAEAKTGTVKNESLLGELAAEMKQNPAKVEVKKDTSSIGMLYQNYEKLTPAEQAALTRNIMTLSRALPKAKDDSDNTKVIQKISLSDMDTLMTKNTALIQKYDEMEENEEELTKAQSTERKNARIANKALKELKDLAANHTDLLNDVTKATKDEKHGTLYNATAATFNAGKKVVQQTDTELGISQMFNAVDKANDRVWEYVKDGKWYGARAATQFVGELGAQATAFTAATGEHIKKYPEKGLNAINSMEEGAGKEITQSTAGVVLNGVSAVSNTLSGITNLASWLLKGGEYTNDDIDRIAGQTIEVIAQKMLDKTEANLRNIQTLFDIRQRLGKTDEELEAMGSDKVEELLKEGLKNNVIPKEKMLLAYGQITGEVTVDKAGKLIITDKTAGIDQLIKAAHQFDDMIVDGLNIASSATGLIHKGTKALDNLVSLDEDDSAIEKTGKVAAQIVTTPVDAVVGSVAGVGNIVSGLAKGIWALIPGTSTTLKDAGNQIVKGAKGTVSGGYWGNDDETVKTAEIKQTQNRIKVAKAHDEVANQKAEVQAHKNALKAEYIDKFIRESGDKLLDDIIPKEKQEAFEAVIAEVAEQQLNGFIAAAKERANQPDITPEEKAEAEELILTLECLNDLENTEKENKLLELYRKNHPEDTEMTVDKLMDLVKADNQLSIKENIKEGITALLRASANPEDAKRLMTLAENDGFFGKDSSWLKSFINKIDQAYDQNEFGEDHNKFLKFLETTLLDGIILEVPRLLLKESVSTADKGLLSMICLNFIGSLTWLGSGTKKMMKGTKQMLNADYNDALFAGGLNNFSGGVLHTVAGALLPKLKCCSHVILGKHKYLDKWLGEDVCCHKHHVIKEMPKPVKPVPKPKPPCSWIDDPSIDPLFP